MTARLPVGMISLMALTLSACGDGEANDTNASADSQNSEAVEALIQKTMDNMVFVEGGSFEMGDFGPIDPQSEGLPYSPHQDNKHLHTVTLDSYSISAYQVSYSDYDAYTEAAGKKMINTEGRDSDFRAPDVPAGVDWYQARDYCQWLAEETGLPFSLPTEAQWEYAARSRGEFYPFATDNGYISVGENYPTRDEIKSSTPANFSGPYTIGLYQPNPLGVYQMGLNGLEWVNDWYDANYYKESPEHNPQGPESGNEKVERGAPFGDGHVSKLTINRRNSPPDLSIDDPTGLLTHSTFRSHTMRCVVNSGAPL